MPRVIVLKADFEPGFDKRLRIPSFVLTPTCRRRSRCRLCGVRVPPRCGWRAPWLPRAPSMVQPSLACVKEAAQKTSWSPSPSQKTVTKDLMVRCSACQAIPVEIRVVTIGCTCMEQGGGWSLREGSFTVNTRGRLDCAIFFLLPRGPRHERAAAVTRWWRACGREGRGCTAIQLVGRAVS